MAKAQVAFSGVDTFGRVIDVAQSVSGIWYSREYRFDGYGMGFSKWAVLRNGVTFATTGTNKYDGSVFDLPVGRFINWGFNKLEKLDETPKFRLPE